MTSRYFGTDGIRGVVGENLTADLAYRVGQAVATVLMEDKGSRPVVLIGKDTRVSSDMLESALMAGICDMGGDVKPVGTIPTPAVAYLTVRLRLDRLIQKIQLSENVESDPYIALIKRLAVNEKLDFDTAKILITEYKKRKEHNI